MYYLCGANVILRIASEVKKRVNAAKIGHFLGFCFVHIPWLKDKLKRCLQRVIWRLKRHIKTVAHACFNVYGDESRMRIARSPFSTKNQIDNKYQTSYLDALSRSTKQQSHPSFGEVRMIRVLPICSSLCKQGDREDCMYPFEAIRRYLTSLSIYSSELCCCLRSAGHNSMVLARLRSAHWGMINYFTTLKAMEA